MILTLAVLFVGMIVLLAFYLNSVLDRRAERRLKRESEKRRESS